MRDPFHSTAGSDLLDRLLGLSPLAGPGPWFTTRTMARCLSEKSAPVSSVGWNSIFARWALPAVALLFAGGLALQQAHRIHTLQKHQQHRVQEAFEVMASMTDDTSDTSTPDPSL